MMIAMVRVTLLTAFLVPCAFAQGAPQTLDLSNGWRIQSSAKATDGGDTISQAGYDTSSWNNATIPNTILGNLVDDSNFSAEQDPFYGMNLMTLMGTPPFDVTTNEQDGMPDPVPPSSPFYPPWWYQMSVTLPASAAGSHVDLKLDGASYGVEVWVNGQQINHKDTTTGTYRELSFDITAAAKFDGNPTTIAIEIWAPQPHDLTASWVDWNHTPQDHNMGLWRGAHLLIHDAVSLSYPMVVSTVDSDYSHAALTIETIASNTSSQAVTGTLKAAIGDIACAKAISFNATETKTVQISPQDCAGLNVSHPKLWWPAVLGPPTLQHLDLSFEIDGKVSDQQGLNFGIRQITSSLNAQGSRQFTINGYPLLIRGAAWAPDLFLRYSADRVAKEFRYVKDMGLNTIRLEGDFQPDAFYDLADRKGILLMPGLVCCTTWQDDAANWSDSKMADADASVRSLLLQLRSHPSVMTFLYGSDEVPAANAEKVYLKAIHDLDWPDPYQASASNRDSAIGKTGYKMAGPYDYVPPSYWYTDKKFGGAFGFNTETCPGTSMPTMEQLRRFIPADHSGAVDSVWNFHAGEREFSTIQRHTDAVVRRFGAIQSVPDMVAKSQLLDYDTHRAMFEAFSRNKLTGATGIVQWMLNSAWNSLNWHLYDHFLAPTAAYFAVKEANRPLHVQYDYDDQKVSLINSGFSAVNGLRVLARVFDINSQPLNGREVTVNAVPNGSQELFAIPPPSQPKNGVYFVSLELRDPSGLELDHNFYWLSTTPDTYVYGNDATDWIAPKITGEGDFSSLASMPKASIHVSRHWNPTKGIMAIYLHNKSTAIALQVRLRMSLGQDDIDPIIWSENHVTLLPGERRAIQARVLQSVAGMPELHGEGFNVPAW